MSCAVNKRLSVVVKRFGRFSVLIGFVWTWVPILTYEKVNTCDLYYNKFHTQRFVYSRSWPDLIRHRDIVYTRLELWCYFDSISSRILAVRSTYFLSLSL